MRIDFIKWMVGYAEGFSWNQFGFGVNIPERAYSVTPKEFEQDKLMYSLLLQRAIEGINKQSNIENISIIQYPNAIKCRCPKSFEICYHFIKNIDQAKEQALKYIWEATNGN